MAIFTALLITLVLLIAIVWACTIFTNAIEWLGHRFKLSEGAVGSVLAAVGTALPETLVPTVALIQGAVAQYTGHGAQAAENAAHIGIGAILGAPFLLSTLGFCLVGGSVIYFSAKQVRGHVLHIDLHLFKRDLKFFFPAYGMVFLASFVPSMLFKWALAIGLIAFYGVYVYQTLRIEHVPDEEFELEPLMIARKSSEPATALIVLQTFLGLAAIVLMAHLFVGQIESLSTLFQLPPLLLSLIIAPIATELPEKVNSVFWIGKKRDNLALGNITGAMVFQSCIPPALGLAFTPWVLDFQGQLSVILCFLSAAVAYFGVMMRGLLSPNYLLIGGLFYLVFLVYSVVKILHGGS